MNDAIPKELIDRLNARLRAIGSQYYILLSGWVGRYRVKATHNPSEEDAILLELARFCLAEVERAIDDTTPNPEEAEP